MERDNILKSQSCIFCLSASNFTLFNLVLCAEPPAHTLECREAFVQVSLTQDPPIRLCS